MSDLECFRVTTEDERRACLDVLIAVRAQELNRAGDESVVESHAFAGRRVAHELYGCRERTSGRTVACVRATPAAALADVASVRNEYLFDLLEDVLEHALVVTRLAVLPAYRKTGAGSALVTWSYARSLDHGALLLVMTCEPILLPMYGRLGFRPIGRAHGSPSGGYRIPMVLVLHDEAHLARCGSPFLAALRARPEPRPRAGVAWYERLVGRAGEIDPGVHVYGARPEDESARAVPFAEMSDEGCRALLENAVVLRCRVGDRVVARGDGGRNVYLVRRGAVEVRRDAGTLAVLGEGELFGELAFLLGRRRNADVIATAEDTEVVCVSLGAVERLAYAADRAAFWRSVADDLARKLLGAHASDG